MRRTSYVVLSLLLASIIASGSLPISHAQATVVQLWSNPMAVNDVAVSKDGQFIAAVNGTGIYFFAWNNSIPIWWYLANQGQLPETFMSVAISSDGNFVVAGNNTGFIKYFNNSQARVGEQTSPTWTSVDLGGPIERRTLDISDDGNYVVVGGTGIDVYYFGHSTTRSGDGQSPSWAKILNAFDVSAVDLSSNGKYLAVGGRNLTGGFFKGFVVFFNNATASLTPKWDACSQIISQTLDVAVSDDGYSVASVDLGNFSVASDTLHYWASATTLSGDPNATWTNLRSYGSVDMSSDGSKVVAGTSPSGIFAVVCGIHFWDNSRSRTGLSNETWKTHAGEDVFDVAISNDGSIIAASTMNTTGSYKAYFFTSTNATIGEFVLDSPGQVVSMSGDGHITAIAGGLTAIGGTTPDTLYVYELKTPTVGGELTPISTVNPAIPIAVIAAASAAAALGYTFTRKHH